MSANLEQFSADLHQEVLAKAFGGEEAAEGRLQHLREEVFTEEVLGLLEEHNEIEGWELCTYEGKNIGALSAAKLNAWALSPDGATLDLVVTVYNGSGKVMELGKTDTRRHFELAIGFLKRAFAGFHKRMEEASDAFLAAQAIHDAKDQLATVRLFVISDCVMRSLDISAEKIPGIDVKYVAWDLEKLSQLRVGERSAIEITFGREYGGPIACLEAPAQTRELRTFLAFFPAPLLAKIYGQYGQRLLERNVRAFLQVKGKVNKGLQKTLKEEPDRFLAYNNGLCCTAAEVETEFGRDGAALLTAVRDFQIVNGGQTTASIFHAIKKEGLDLDEVMVQVKLTVIRDAQRVTEIVPMISKYANSQNKVNGADFAANGKFHRDLEALSRTVWAPSTSGMERGTHWYYERARGSYMDDKARQGSPSKKKEWAQRNSPTQKFTKTDLAKFEHAWLGLPHLVCRGAEKNFDQFASRLEDDGEPDVTQEFFQHVVARAILWKSAERVFDDLELVGYRAQSVAYAVAWLAEKSGRRLNLDRIWKDQHVSTHVQEVLQIICFQAHRFLSTQLGNVGEASKKPDTWSSFRAKELDVGNGWQRELLDATPPDIYLPKRPNPAATAARDQFSLIPAESWFELAKWAKERGFLEGWERKLAFSLGKIAANGWRASDKQIAQGVRIMGRARELGFSGSS